MLNPTPATAKTMPKVKHPDMRSDRGLTYVVNSERRFKPPAPSAMITGGGEPAYFRRLAERAANSLLREGLNVYRDQAECIEALLAGYNVIAQLPTGRGKSLTFQAFARIQRARTGSGDVLVVNPSIALSDDHVGNAKDLNLRAFRYHSRLKRHKAEAAADAWRTGNADILVCSPEALPSRISALGKALAQRPPSLVVIDEGHLISAWGMSYRADYLEIRPNLEAHYGELLAHIPMLVLSATLTERAERDAIERLGIADNLFRLRGSVLRANIRIRLIHAPGEDVWAYPPLLAPLIEKHRGAIIIYPLFATDTEKLSRALNAQHGYNVVRYHSQERPSEDEPQRWQQHTARKFRQGGADAMLATVAYGMGIDLPYEIRAVACMGIPMGIDAFVQQIGRAGRKGSESEGILFYSDELAGKQQFLVDSSWPSPDTMLGVLKTHARTKGQLQYIELPPAAKDADGNFRVNSVGNLMKHTGEEAAIRSCIPHLRRLRLIEPDRTAYRGADGHGAQPFRLTDNAGEIANNAFEAYAEQRERAFVQAEAMRNYVDKVTSGECAQKDILATFDDPLDGDCLSLGALPCSSCEEHRAAVHGAGA